MKLRRPPLIYVVAQSGFTPVLTLREHLATIQGGFRSIGFPRYQQGQIANVAIAPGSQPAIAISPRWDFLDREKRTMVALTERSLSVATSGYVTYRPFAAQLRSALEVIQPFATGALMERTGLRYIDSIRLEPGEEFSDYVIPELLGFGFHDIPIQPEGMRAFRTDSLAQTTAGMLIVRAYQLARPQFLPPDLWPSPLTFPSGVDAIPSVTLDFDHTTDRTLDFDPGAVTNVLDELHGVLGVAFRRAVTPAALMRWEAVEEVVS